MLLIKHPIQGGAAGTHTFSKLSFSQILRTRPSLNCNCTHSEIYRPVPSLAGMNRPGFTRHFLAYKFRPTRGCHECEAIYRGISN